MLPHLLQAEGIVASVAFVFLLLRSFYAMFRAAANRSLGVSWWTALQAIALTFPDSAYTPVGKKWCRVWRSSVLSVILSMPLFFCVAYLTVWLFKLLGLPVDEAAEVWG